MNSVFNFDFGCRKWYLEARRMLVVGCIFRDALKDGQLILC